MDRILIILKKENGPRASSAPALGLNTIIFKHVYWYMQQTQVSVYRTIGPLVLSKVWFGFYGYDDHQQRCSVVVYPLTIGVYPSYGQAKLSNETDLACKLFKKLQNRYDFQIMYKWQCSFAFVTSSLLLSCISYLHGVSIILVI